MEYQSIPASVSTGGEWTIGESSDLPAGCREGWSFHRTSARDAGQGVLRNYSSFGKAGWIFSQSRTVQFPQTLCPSPIPRASVTPEATEESHSASQWQESNWHFTSELTEGGEEEGLASGKKQGRFPRNAVGCHTDIPNRHAVAKTLPQRPFWGKVRLSRMQSSINLLDQDAQAHLSISGELKGEGVDGFGNHNASQQLEMKPVNLTYLFPPPCPMH